MIDTKAAWHEKYATPRYSFRQQDPEGTRFLIHREQREQVTVTHLTVRLRVAEVLGIIDGADILQKLGIHGAVLHTAKQISYIHFVSSCILDW